MTIIIMIIIIMIIIIIIIVIIIIIIIIIMTMKVPYPFPPQYLGPLVVFWVMILWNMFLPQVCVAKLEVHVIDMHHQPEI